MRIISGEFRGTPLHAPPGLRTRPITDRAKETLFSVLGHRFGSPGKLPPVDVLDLFAGSGSLGLEALSRGAAWCGFNERDRAALRALRANIGRLGLDARCGVTSANAYTMRLPRGPAGSVGLVFLDPPYADALDPQPLLDLLERLAGRLAPDGLVAYRCQARHRVPAGGLSGLSVVDERTLGEMRICILARPAGERAEPRAEQPG